MITEKTKVEEKTNSTFTTVKIKGATASAAGKYKCVAMKNGSTIEGEIEVLSKLIQSKLNNILLLLFF